MCEVNSINRAVRDGSHNLPCRRMLRFTPGVRSRCAFFNDLEGSGEKTVNQDLP